jgi:predicted nucleic acid-binding protein
MLCPDVNVLLYAFRRDSTDHTRYADWLQRTMAGKQCHLSGATRAPAIGWPADHSPR